jgi:carbon monoxide dehydrogenase subunit G
MLGARTRHVKLEHSFHVDEDIDAAWNVLNDVQRVAQCMPGAALDTVDGDDITGRCKVKLGPIALTYRGQATFIERDAAAHRIVLQGQGKDGASGSASVTVIATLSAAGPRTRVDLDTDLKLTGKPAQFGRGVMADVGDRLIGQFADTLAEQLAAEKPAANGVGPRFAYAESDFESAEPLDLLSVAGQAMVRRTAMVGIPLVAVLLVLATGLRRASRRRARRR